MQDPWVIYSSSTNPFPQTLPFFVLREGFPGCARQAVGDDLVDSVVGDNIPILTEQEKFNEAVSSIVKRVSAKLTGVRRGGPAAHLARCTRIEAR